MVSTAQLAAAAASTSASASGSRDKFSSDEVRDLFICLLSVVQVLDTNRMNQLASKSLKDLFLCLECVLNAFEYKPAVSRTQETGTKSRTLPSYLTGITGCLDLATVGTNAASGKFYNFILIINKVLILSIKKMF